MVVFIDGAYCSTKSVTGMEAAAVNRHMSFCTWTLVSLKPEMLVSTPLRFHLHTFAKSAAGFCLVGTAGTTERERSQTPEELHTLRCEAVRCRCHLHAASYLSSNQHHVDPSLNSHQRESATVLEDLPADHL